MAQLRSALFMQAAITALFGLWHGGSGSWTIATMVIAAAAVFIGSALQPTPEMRTAALAFEGVAIGFGVVGLVVNHYIPGTIVAAGVLVQLLGSSAGLAFAGAPDATLQVYGAPVPPAPPTWTPPVPPPVEEAAAPAPAPVIPVQPTSASASMTILPQRR